MREETRRKIKIDEKLPMNYTQEKVVCQSASLRLSTAHKLIMLKSCKKMLSEYSRPFAALV